MCKGEREQRGGVKVYVREQTLLTHLGHSYTVLLVVIDRYPIFEFSLSHERNVDAVSSSYGYKRYKPSNQWWDSLQEHSIVTIQHSHTNNSPHFGNDLVESEGSDSGCNCGSTVGQ